MMDERASRIALAASLLFHAALFAPVREFLPLPAEKSEAAPAPRDEPMVFRFVDTQPEPAETPDEPSELLSTTDARAAQPEAPVDAPEGAAYAAGPAPVPTTPRTRGSESPGDRPARESHPTPPADRDTERPEREATTAVDREATPTARTDPRLAMPRSRPRLPVGGAATPGRDALPAPEVDQRLTRAAAGSEFSLNTTAWRWGPYMERLKRAIERNIAPPAAFYYGTAAWITRVRFRIAPDGTLTHARLLDHRGVDDLQYVAMDAIADAADYEPLPTDFPEPYLEITANFYFNVTGDR